MVWIDVKSILGKLSDVRKQPTDDLETVSAVLERVVEAQARTNELLGELIDLVRPPVTPPTPPDDKALRVMSRAEREAELAYLDEIIGPEEADPARGAPKRSRRRRGGD